MEASPANRLPEADSLPDGFVDSSAEPTPPAADYKDSLLDLHLDLDRPNEPAAEALDQESMAAALRRLTTSTELEPSEGTGGLGSTAADRLEESKDVGSQEEYQMSEDSKVCTELHTGNLRESSAVDLVECMKRQESSDAKHKVAKRSTRLEKELLELTLKYQKVITERDSAVAVRERLESLCRELQRQNKMLMEDCRRVSTEGQHLRLDLSAKFNNAIKDVSSKLEEQKEECLSQLRENEMLRNKLKDLADQYVIAEQQFAQKLKEKMLQLELADLKIQHHQERSTQEQTQMKLYAEQVSQLMVTEKSLRLQLAADGEKFQQFQEALSKSNEVFETYKQEMEKMVKLIKDLKKENEFLKGKCEKSDIALVKLIEEREFMKKQLEKLKNQKEKLESLCRSLQAERKQSLAGSNADLATTQGGPGKES